MEVGFVPSSRFRRLSSQTQKFESLREMNFKSCKFLRGIPDLSGASSLTELCFDDCTNLFEIHDSVGYLNKLERLSAMRCKNLKILPRGLSMASLEHLNLYGCSSVQYFPKILVKMTKMRTLELDRTAIVELPSSICILIGLGMLNMEECHHLKQLPASIFMLPNLWSLSTNFCKGMRYLKICEDGEEASIDCRNESSKMEYFYFSNCNLSNDSCTMSFLLPKFDTVGSSGGEFTTLPACMEECYCMKYLFVDNCKRLQHILGMPPSLEKFSAINCALLTTISKGRVLDQEVYHKQGKLKYVFPEKEFPEFLDTVSHNPPLSFWIREEFPMILICILVKDLLDSLFYLNISVLINGDSQEFPSDQWFSTSKVNHLYMFDLYSIISKADLKLSQSKRNAWNYVEIFINNSTPGLELVPKIYLGAAVCKQDIKFNNISFLRPGSKYDVFMSVDQDSHFDSFTGMLCRALYGSKINVFKRVKDLGWVEDICPTVVQAIEESRISIIVFSEFYAYYTWCLDTLAMIIDCMKTKGKLVFPIFYHVDPSDVRHQSGSFGLAMDDHESMEKGQKWKLALSEAAHLRGWSITAEMDIDGIIPRIVEVVSRHLRLEHLTKSVESTGNTMGHREQPGDRLELEDGIYWDLNSMKSTDLTESIRGHQGPGHDVLILSFEEACINSDIFVDDLYNALCENNINAFKDVGSFGWSEDLDPTALRAIEESRISIITLRW
ncbi:TMV resistance protein N-like isoform X2 [Prosopis cineraria]|uniref:TMV resistance protein N-like isoform X2 n=1 Tax=Prosopis cineraria TaxID=364024 RepID=UPI00240F69B3|nr:TMV resistance protein N-like isoform X2 [Prosopis cineraria]